MKINRSLKFIMSMGIMGINSVAIASDNSADITALKTEIKNLKTSIANLTDMMRNQSAQATQINELKTRMNSINSSQNLELANLEKRAVIGNTSCYNLRKNPKTKVYTIGSKLDINDGEYLLCGVLSTRVAFFTNGVTAFDYILHAGDLDPLLRFTKLGNSYTQEFKKLVNIRGKILQHLIFTPLNSKAVKPANDFDKKSYYFDTDYIKYNSYASSSGISNYVGVSNEDFIFAGGYRLKFDNYDSPPHLMTLYVLNINDI